MKFTLSQYRTKLLNERAALESYLVSKTDKADWHGVADAAMDIREVDAKIKVLEMIQSGELADVSLLPGLT